MMKFFLSLKFSLPICSLSQARCPGDVAIVSDQNSVGWFFGPHRLVDRRSQELLPLLNFALVFMCTQDATVELLGLFTHFFLEIRGRQ